MKVKIKEKPEFQPVVIELTIESLDELKCLYHRFNESWGSVKRAADNTDIAIPDKDSGEHTIFKEISNQLK